MEHFTQKFIESKIYMIRNQKVMIDADLAALYSVETGQLNRAVQRNPLRFPEDFAFKLTPAEYRDLLILRSKEEIFKRKHGVPYAFTENGVAMLSSVLHSEEAISVNVAIMRIFGKLRNFPLLEQNISNRLDELETHTSQVFQLVFERLDGIEKDLIPNLPSKRNKIGLYKKSET